MFGFDFLPATPEKLVDRFWSDQSQIVYSPRGAGRSGVIVTEQAGRSVVERYHAHYVAVRTQLKWTLRTLAILMVLILFVYRGNFPLGSVFSLLMLILLMLLTIVGMNTRLIIYRRSLVRPLLVGAVHPGLSRKERIEQGYAFGPRALAVIAGLIAITAGVAFAIHTAILQFELGGYVWIWPALVIGFSVCRFIWGKVAPSE
jgi:hypothetical protein